MKTIKLHLYLILTISVWSLPSSLFCSEQEKDFQSKRLTSSAFKNSANNSLSIVSSNTATSDIPPKKPVTKSYLSADSYCFNSLGELVEKDFARPLTPPPSQHDIKSYLSFHQPFQPSSRKNSSCSAELLKYKSDKNKSSSDNLDQQEKRLVVIRMHIPSLETTTSPPKRSLLAKSGQSSLLNPALFGRVWRGYKRGQFYCINFLSLLNFF